MKKLLPILITAVLAASAAAAAPAADSKLNLLLSGSEEANVFSIKLSPDGRDYLIDSNAPLAAPEGVCTQREGRENALSCPAPAIASFEVNAGAGDDTVTFAAKVPAPVTLRGGAGDDRLSGGADGDKLIGGSGEDTLVGRAGNDWIFGGPGDDKIFGGPGDDRLVGNAGSNRVFGGPGENRVSLLAR